MSTPKHELESISVRRAKVADSDKVRYRVYTSPTEFIAVIAESALMAVKVSEVKVPYKIMRDLPTDGVAIEARKMAEIEKHPERVNFRLDNDARPSQRLTEMEDPDARTMQPFVPVGIADLRSKGGNRARILPPEMVNQIIEEHAKAHAPTQEPVPEYHEPMETVMLPEPELSAAEKITLMAQEMALPDADPVEPASKNPDGGLSPEEVEQLLNGS